jgi:hypothetical protein
MGDDAQTPGEKKIEDDLDAVDKDPQAVGGDGAPPPPTRGDEPSAGSSGTTTPTTSVGSGDKTTGPVDGGDKDPARDKFEKLHGDQGH